MPELPEVETVKKGLERRLSKFFIKRIEIQSERSISNEGGSYVFAKEMVGMVVGEWTRRGKYLICKLHCPQEKIHTGWWVVHLRMTGYFQWFSTKAPSCPHTRVRIWNKANAEIRFVDTRNFGQMWWISSKYLPEEKISGLMKLGPEPLSEDFNPSYLQKSLEKRTRSIKASLLDQSIIAGVGNIYADESLFEAGILPTKESKGLSKNEISRLCTCLPQILKSSIGEGGTTFKDFRDLEGLNGNYGNQAWVYRRGNQPCRKCGTTINRAKVAGRVTHWCPQCQK